MPNQGKKLLPSAIREWEKEAEEHQVLDRSIHDILKATSASKIGPEQYYSLRALWVVHDGIMPDATVLGFSKEDATYRQASDYLKNESPSWQSYLADLLPGPNSSSPNKVRDIGAFSTVRYYQLHIDPLSIPYMDSEEKAMDSVSSKFSPPNTRSIKYASTQPKRSIDTPSRDQRAMDESSSLDLSSFLGGSPAVDRSFIPPDPQSPITRETSTPSEDEQIVNVALVLWLQTLVMFHPLVQEKCLKWSVKRLQLKFGEWEARTDGCLRRGTGVKAILEVKPYAREQSIEAIQKQESAQMASWIRNFPHDGGWLVVKEGRQFERRLFISQDSTEIYLTIAEFEPAYKDYLCSKEQSKVRERSFMTMNQYGPWDVRTKRHMEHLGKLLLAFTLRFCHTRNDSFEQKPASITTSTTLEKREAPNTPTPAAPKNPTKRTTRTTDTTQKPTSSRQSGKGKTETVEMPEMTGASGANRTTGTTQMALPLRRSGRSKGKETDREGRDV